MTKGSSLRGSGRGIVANLYTIIAGTATGTGISVGVATTTVTVVGIATVTGIAIAIARCSRPAEHAKIPRAKRQFRQRSAHERFD